jgi:hypothetical protein
VLKAKVPSLETSDTGFDDPSRSESASSLDPPHSICPDGKKKKKKKKKGKSLRRSHICTKKLKLGGADLVL